MRKKADFLLESITDNHYRLQGKVNMQMNDAAMKSLLALPDLIQIHPQSTQIHLDVSGLQSSDSVLLAIILELARSMKKRGIALKVSGLSDPLQGLAKVFGVDLLINSFKVIA